MYQDESHLHRELIASLDAEAKVSAASTQPKPQKHHVLMALKFLSAQGVPEEMQGKSYYLGYQNGEYPPKLVLALARVLARNEPKLLARAKAEAEGLNGGEQVNSVLKKLGFSVRKHK